tara:strand:+ start:362 stop:946 length:585 start_codon:yes stop_codon:yes gene_type:complete
MSEVERYQKFCDKCLAKYTPEDILGATEVEHIVRFLIPKDVRPPEKVIKGISKNWSTKKSDNIYYHVLRVIPKLFIAGLHCETPTDEYGCPESGHKFHTRFLSKRLAEPAEEIKHLERDIIRERENNHYDELIDNKNKVNELKEQLKELKEINTKLEDKLQFKEDQLKNTVSKKHLEEVMKELEALRGLDKTET